MDQPLPDTDLVVATPERVSFDYQVAGLGTRAIAQILDLLILTGVLAGLYFAAVPLGAAGVKNIPSPIRGGGTLRVRLCRFCALREVRFRPAGGQKGPPSPALRG